MPINTLRYTTEEELKALVRNAAQFDDADDDMDFGRTAEQGITQAAQQVQRFAIPTGVPGEFEIHAPLLESIAREWAYYHNGPGSNAIHKSLADAAYRQELIQLKARVERVEQFLATPADYMEELAAALEALGYRLDYTQPRHMFKHFRWDIRVLPVDTTTPSIQLQTVPGTHPDFYIYDNGSELHYRDAAPDAQDAARQAVDAISQAVLSPWINPNSPVTKHIAAVYDAAQESSLWAHTVPEIYANPSVFTNVEEALNDLTTESEWLLSASERELVATMYSHLSAGFIEKYGSDRAFSAVYSQVNDALYNMSAFPVDL